MYLAYFFLFVLLTNGLFAQSSDDFSTDNKRTDATFPGGIDSLYYHLEQSFRISMADYRIDQLQEFVADLHLTINARGEVVTVNSGRSTLGYELERAFMMMPPFIPATNKGKPVVSYINIKFTYTIAGNRIRIVQHMHYKPMLREKNTGSLKLGLIAAAALVTLFFMGIY